MPVTQDDLEAWARWVGMRFDPPVRATAEAVASILIDIGGARPDFLRPDTPMPDVLAWLKGSKASGFTSLDWVELLMLIEEELKSNITDDVAATFEKLTFGAYIHQLHAHRRAA